LQDAEDNGAWQIPWEVARSPSDGNKCSGLLNDGNKDALLHLQWQKDSISNFFQILFPWQRKVKHQLQSLGII